ncbi:MAG: hypothetical protein IPM25_01210 [Chloracidobacterium sp.]|nr:hypothetical protein [Chloracidobacterium sp.]
MTRSIFFVSAILFLFAFASPSQDDTRPTATWRVMRYDLTGTAPTQGTERNLTLKARLDLKNVSSRPATTVTLRIAPSAAVSSISINSSTADFTKAEEKIGAGTALQRVQVRVPSVQPEGQISLTVDYKFEIKENTGVHSLSPVGMHLLPNAFWYPTPNSWFFTRGSDFAPARLRIEAPGLTVVSSGSESGGAFDQKLNVQPFAIAGSWDILNEAGVSVYVPKGAGADERKRASELAAVAVDAQKFAAALLGPAPDVPLRIVAVKRGGGFSGGGTVLVDESALRRSKLDSQTVMNVADAVVKTWISGSVHVSGDGFGVVREGLTRYIATQFIEQKYGPAIAEVERLRQRTAYAAVVRRDAPLSQVSPLDDFYYSGVANKGAMVWRLAARTIGQNELFGSIRNQMKDGDFSLAEFRSSQSSNKELMDNLLDQVTETNLLAGLPNQVGGEWTIALRNTGPIDVTVNVAAGLADGQTMSAPVTVKAKSYGEIAFRTPQRVVRVEVDPEKYYPQTDYSDDIAPRETTDSDLLLAVKRPFDLQKFADAEKMARTVLASYPNFDDVRILLARSLLGQNKMTDAEREFSNVLAEKLPTARSLAWANVGLAETAQRSGRNPQAIRFAEEAIKADAEYGAGLAARSVRTRANAPHVNDEAVKAFFTQFDRAAISNRKAELEALVVPGEVTRFVSGISGQAVEWKTNVLYVDRMDPDNAWVETNLSIKLLDKEVETGLAVFRLARVGSAWKLAGVDIFEVR